MSRVTRSYWLTTFEIARKPKIPRGTSLYWVEVVGVFELSGIRRQENETDEERRLRIGKRKNKTLDYFVHENFRIGTHSFT